MRLNNVITLINAELKSRANIVAFEKIVVDVKRVLRGDLFIAYNSLDIPQALSLGAYGIIYDEDIEILDDEVAFLRVSSCDDALLRVLRFSLLNKKIKSYDCDKITIELASCLEYRSDVLVINSALKTIYSKIVNLNENSVVLFSSKITPIELFIDSTCMIPNIEKTITTIEKTVFETTFIYRDNYYDRVLFSPFFTPYLEKLFNFLDSISIEFILKTSLHVEHFTPIFCDKDLNIVDFGMSQKVLIFENDMELIETQIDFLKSMASWAKMLYFIPLSFKSRLSDTLHVEYYADDMELLTLMETKSYHYGLVAGKRGSFLDNRNKTKEKRQLVMEF
ncbi:MAG: hypothetical protein U9N42_03725 [Campylobacterota bacterium]|nr:hypothetical protein [Campylobacterota bacterium]